MACGRALVYVGKAERFHPHFFGFHSLASRCASAI